MNEEKNARQRIIDAYLDALKTRRYDRITVSSVINKADVNRSTFYRNFIDIYDLYDNVCEETADRIVYEVCEKMKSLFNKGFNLECMHNCYEIVFDVFMNNKRIISLLSGSKGSLMLLKKFRDECEKSISMPFPLFNETLECDYQAGLLSDVSVLFVYTMYSFRTGENFFKLKDILPDTPLKKDFVSNILTVNDILDNKKSSIEYKLLMAVYDEWKNKKSVNLTVCDITKAAGISRTEFYLCHKNIADFYANFENIAVYVLTKYVLVAAFADIEKLKNNEFNVKELSDNINSFLDSIEYVELFTFLFRACGATIDKYFQILIREYGKEYIKNNEYNFMFYICAVFNIVVRYAISGKEEQFLASMKLADNFKKMFTANNDII